MPSYISAELFLKILTNLKKKMPDQQGLKIQLKYISYLFYIFSRYLNLICLNAKFILQKCLVRSQVYCLFHLLNSDVQTSPIILIGCAI